MAVSEQRDRRFDLVEISRVVPDIRVDLRYARRDNVFGEALYTEGARALLRRGSALKLARAQERLSKSNLSLKVWDAYRPASVHRRMWEKVRDERYVADAEKGSVHSRGAAVDVTLVDSQGGDLSMPTPFDDFTPRAGQSYPDLPAEVRANRALLREVMVGSGFEAFESEWWHFNDAEYNEYPVLDVPFAGT